MNLPVSTLGFFTTALYIVLFGFFWRWASMKYHNTSLGKAMAYIY
jgi:hypothetical protein